MTVLKDLSTFLQQIRFIHTHCCNKFPFPRNQQLIQLLQPSVHQLSTMSSNSPSCYNYIYLHGFASGPRSKKGLLLQTFFAEKQANVELFLPDLNIPSFEKLSVTAIVQHLKNEMLNNEHQYRLIGSSLGGFIAATLALELQKNSKVDSLILLCPALDASNRWKTKMTNSELEQWKLQGTRNYYNFNTKSELPLHYGFYEDLLQQIQYPIVDAPTTIIHGLNDDVVPISTSRKYVELLRKNGSNNELIEVNDDHYLTKVETLEIIKNVIKDQWLETE